MSYPTDLSPEEQRTAAARLAALAERFSADGILRTTAWRSVFERTWRHPYVPSYYPEIDGRCVLSADPQRRAEWLEAVYSDRTLVTEVGHVPLAREFRPGTYPVGTSSGTMPSLLLTMLEALDVGDGHRVLDIGTGTGYGTALLCERLGSDRVVSVDIDAELVELARERLAANGYVPTLAATDGAGGYPPAAPFDRIIATCAVPNIPPAWLRQVRPGAVILADVRGPVSGTLARLVVDDEGAATGPFLADLASFMPIRHRPDTPPPAVSGSLRYDDQADSLGDADPGLLREDPEFAFVAQWHLPEATWAATAVDGEPAVQLWTPDGSWAVARTAPTGHRHRVTQYGPARLWDRVERAYDWWERAGRPSHDRFGLTASAGGQYVWYGQPDGADRWPLPASP
jgi:methyltransferase of ATP-grasp peptide maturase system